MTEPAASRRALLRVALIRFAILFGVLVFGALAWWTREGPAATPAPDPGFLDRLGLVPAIVTAAALAAVLALRVFRGRTREPVARRRLSIVALAPGEAAALFGAVAWFLAGDSRWYVAGMFVLAASIVLFPLREIR